MGKAIMPPSEFPPDNHITKGVQWEKYDFVNSICATYLNLSPKNQARQLGEPKPYIKGTHTAEPKINSELTGTYGRFGKSFMDFFQLTFFKRIYHD
jgi:hypothetical protein